MATMFAFLLIVACNASSPTDDTTEIVVTSEPLPTSAAVPPTATAKAEPPTPVPTSTPVPSIAVAPTSNPLLELAAKLVDAANHLPSHIADINITINEWPERGPTFFSLLSTRFVDEFGNSEWTIRGDGIGSYLGVSVLDRLYRTVDGVTYWSFAYAPSFSGLSGEWTLLEEEVIPQIFASFLTSLIELGAKDIVAERVETSRRFEITGELLEGTSLPSFEISGSLSNGLPDEMIIRDQVDRLDYDSTASPDERGLRTRSYTLSFGVPVEPVTIP